MCRCEKLFIERGRRGQAPTGRVASDLVMEISTCCTRLRPSNTRSRALGFLPSEGRIVKERGHDFCSKAPSRPAFCSVPLVVLPHSSMAPSPSSTCCSGCCTINQRVRLTCVGQGATHEHSPHVPDVADGLGRHVVARCKSPAQARIPRFPFPGRPLCKDLDYRSLAQGRPAEGREFALRRGPRLREAKAYGTMPGFGGCGMRRSMNREAGARHNMTSEAVQDQAHA